MSPSRYASVHEDTDGPGDARPTALQVVKDNNLQDALKDKVIVMTGASAGIGVEAARAFAATGARCFLGVRNLTKGQAACAEFLEPGRVELFQIDTSSLKSVQTAARGVLDKAGGQINVLVNNAGIMANPTRDLSEDGYEMQFATNFLGHFLLYRLVEKAMLKASTPSFNSRVVNVSSSGHHQSTVQLDNLRLDGDAYNPWVGYGQSKTAMIWMTNHIERLHGKDGVHGLSLMPGGIWTDLQRHMGEGRIEEFKRQESVRKFMKSLAQGAATTVYAALDRDWEGKGGEYLEDCDIAKRIDQPNFSGAAGVMPHAFDEANEAKLWAEASRIVGVEP